MLGWLNWPMIDASHRKSRLCCSVYPAFKVLMATWISLFPGSLSGPLHTSPNSPKTNRRSFSVSKHKKVNLFDTKGINLAFWKHSYAHYCNEERRREQTEGFRHHFFELRGEQMLQISTFVSRAPKAFIAVWIVILQQSVWINWLCTTGCVMKLLMRQVYEGWGKIVKFTTTWRNQARSITVGGECM